MLHVSIYRKRSLPVFNPSLFNVVFSLTNPGTEALGHFLFTIKISCYAKKTCIQRRI